MIFLWLSWYLPTCENENKYSNKLVILENSVFCIFPLLYFKNLLHFSNDRFPMLFFCFLFTHHRVLWKNPASCQIWSVPDAQCPLLRSSHRKITVTARKSLLSRHGKVLLIMYYKCTSGKHTTILELVLKIHNCNCPFTHSDLCFIVIMLLAS